MLLQISKIMTKLTQCLLLKFLILTANNQLYYRTMHIQFTINLKYRQKTCYKYYHH